MKRAVVLFLLLFIVLSGCNKHLTRFTNPAGYIETYKLEHALQILDYYRVVCGQVLDNLNTKRLLMVKAANGIYNPFDRRLFYNEWARLVEELSLIQKDTRLPLEGPFLFGTDAGRSIQGLRVHDPFLTGFRKYRLLQSELAGGLKNKYYDHHPQDTKTGLLSARVANQLIGETDTEIKTWTLFRHQVLTIRNELIRRQQLMEPPRKSNPTKG